MALFLYSALFAMWKSVTSFNSGTFLILYEMDSHQLFFLKFFLVEHWIFQIEFYVLYLYLMFLVFSFSILTGLLKCNFQIAYCILYINNIYIFYFQELFRILWLFTFTVYSYFYGCNILNLCEETNYNFFIFHMFWTLNYLLPVGSVFL